MRGCAQPCAAFPPLFSPIRLISALLILIYIYLITSSSSLSHPSLSFFIPWCFFCCSPPPPSLHSSHPRSSGAQSCPDGTFHAEIPLHASCSHRSTPSRATHNAKQTPPLNRKPVLSLDIRNLFTVSPKFNKDDRLLLRGGQGGGNAIQLICNLTFH